MWLQFYQYFHLPKPDEFRSAHEALCTSLGLTGRVRVSPEGVNGTCAGARDAVAEYVAALRRERREFEDTDFKVSACPDGLQGFDGLVVKVRASVLLFCATRVWDQCARWCCRVGVALLGFVAIFLTA